MLDLIVFSIVFYFVVALTLCGFGILLDLLKERKMKHDGTKKS